MGFIEITGPDYTELLLKRLQGKVPELTWLKQFRNILQPKLRRGVTMLDIGCATGYAYNSFKEFGIVYTGLDIEPEYLKVAAQWFSGITEVNFIRHDITISAPPKTAEIVICSAMLEHCPCLEPTLGNLVSGAERTLMLRTFLGAVEHIHCIPSPVPEHRDTHQKYNNQYSFKDVLGYIEGRGFNTRVYRDQYTDSMPQFVDGVERTFYIVYGEKNTA